jgi:hypothetical protein
VPSPHNSDLSNYSPSSLPSIRKVVSWPLEFGEQPKPESPDQDQMRGDKIGTPANTRCPRCPPEASIPGSVYTLLLAAGRPMPDCFAY